MSARERWDLFAFCAAVLLLNGQIYSSLSLNLEGLALLAFRFHVGIDPYGALVDWDPDDEDPCGWLGVRCVDGRVESLYLNELSLGGLLAPELGKLSHLRALALHKNNFTGVIPKEIGGLTMLELLDLRSNNLSGIIPRELGEVSSLKCLLLCGNKFQSGQRFWVERPDLITDLKYDADLSCEMVSDIGCNNRKVGHWFKFLSDSSTDDEEKHGDNLSRNFAVVNTVRRQLLEESKNLAAMPVRGNLPPQNALVPSIGSGSFAAVPKEPSPSTVPINQPVSPPKQTSDKPTSSKGLGIWVYVIIALGAAVLLALAASILLLCCRKGGAAIGPWRTGISGQLQKAFVTGIPKLSRSELEAACEDFSNIITSFTHCTLFKGTLSSGVEIAVVSTTVKSMTDWSEQSELYFRKKLGTLSRVNHKNFVNLIGYCEEDEPFMRMMVFEYSPNGTLFDHLHVKEYEHLEWSARMRVIMGMAYCLQYMHHEINPPVTVPDLQSHAIFITNDFAAKIVDICLYRRAEDKKSVSGVDDEDPSKLLDTDLESNVHSFGILMLEIISGKIPYTEEGSIIDWGANYLDNNSTFSSLLDPTLKTSNENELEIVFEMIRGCLQLEPGKRPTMKEVTTSLKDVLGISPEAATPRTSPLWWAELEILSVEAS